MYACLKEKSIMEFNANRLLELSGIKSDEDPQPLNESRISNNGKEQLSEEALVEAHIRKAIRNEINAIVQEMREKGDTDWMYRGMKKPNSSQAGKVTMGLLGLGFAKEGE